VASFDDIHARRLQRLARNYGKFDGHKFDFRYPQVIVLMDMIIDPECIQGFFKKTQWVFGCLRIIDFDTTIDI
jgi:hypothetical protein